MTLLECRSLRSVWQIACDNPKMPRLSSALARLKVRAFELRTLRARACYLVPDFKPSPCFRLTNPAGVTQTPPSERQRCSAATRNKELVADGWGKTSEDYGLLKSCKVESGPSDTKCAHGPAVDIWAFLKALIVT